MGQMNYGDYPDIRGVRKILIVKLRHLGDVLLAGPVFFALKKAIPQASIDALIYEESAPMLSGHPAIRRLILCDRRWKKLKICARILAEVRAFREIRREGYDLVVNLTEGDRGVWAAFLSGAKIRVGFKPKGKLQQKILSHIAKDCPSPRHAVERNLDVLRRIGIFPADEEKELFFHLPSEARQRAQEWTEGKPFILIHPTSRWRFKCWPIAKMRQLIFALLQEGRRIVLTSGPEDMEKAILKEIAQGQNVLNLGGGVSLKELGALIEIARCLICVDSVPLHLASALKKPVIALFGPTSEIAWGPWRNPHARILTVEKTCRPCGLDGCGGGKKSDCLEEILVKSVLSAVSII